MVSPVRSRVLIFVVTSSLTLGLTQLLAKDWTTIVPLLTEEDILCSHYFQTGPGDDQICIWRGSFHRTRLRRAKPGTASHSE
jgi:hypothetical protein